MDVSRHYSTPAFPAGAGPDFVNAAVRVKTSLSPENLLEALHHIEEQLGRVRKTRWGARVVDLDLLAYGGCVLPDLAGFRYWHDLAPARQHQETPSQLILPHPRLQDRGFVLVPLCDIAPNWRHPVLNKTATELRDLLPQAEIDQIRALPRDKT